MDAAGDDRDRGASVTQLRGGRGGALLRPRARPGDGLGLGGVDLDEPRSLVERGGQRRPVAVDDGPRAGRRREPDEPRVAVDRGPGRQAARERDDRPRAVTADRRAERGLDPSPVRRRPAGRRPRRTRSARRSPRRAPTGRSASRPRRRPRAGRSTGSASASRYHAPACPPRTATIAPSSPRCRAARTTLAALPPATTDRTTGRWIGPGDEAVDGHRLVDRGVEGDADDAADRGVGHGRGGHAGPASPRTAASASARVGWPSVPPAARVDSDPHATASRSAASSGRPSSQAARNPALNESPAPVVSTASTAIAAARAERAVRADRQPAVGAALDGDRATRTRRRRRRGRGRRPRGPRPPPARGTPPRSAAGRPPPRPPRGSRRPRRPTGPSWGRGWSSPRPRGPPGTAPGPRRPAPAGGSSCPTWTCRARASSAARDVGRADVGDRAHRGQDRAVRAVAQDHGGAGRLGPAPPGTRTRPRRDPPARRA